MVTYFGGGVLSGLSSRFRLVPLASVTAPPSLADPAFLAGPTFFLATVFVFLAPLPRGFLLFNSSSFSYSSRGLAARNDSKSSSGVNGSKTVALFLGVFGVEQRIGGAGRGGELQGGEGEGGAGGDGGGGGDELRGREGKGGMGRESGGGGDRLRGGEGKGGTFLGCGSIE